MAYLRFRNDLFQVTGEVGNYHDGYGTGIPELVFHLTGRIEWICVHYDQSRTQCAEEGNWKLKQVGHLNGYALARLESEVFLKISGKIPGQFIDLFVRELSA